MAALAGGQHGVVARGQIEALGLGRHEIARQLRRGRLHSLHRGVYAVGHRRLPGLGIWMAVLAAGPGAVLSHRSAGALWGVRAWSGRRVEIAVPRRRRARDGLVLHETHLPLDERDEHEGIPVTKRRLDGDPGRLAAELRAMLRSATTAAPAPPPGPRTRGRRSRRAAR